MRITILGCGASSGVPIVGCTCKVCSSQKSYNKRLRSSALITCNSTNILIDSGPDIRQQALKNSIHTINAIIYTHAHSDHINGADDMQRFKTPNESSNFIPIYGDEYTINALKQRSAYLFEPITIDAPWRKSFLLENIVSYYDTIKISDISIVSFPQKHGNITSLGLIFNNKIAYCTDVKELPEPAYDLLSNIELLVIGCIGYREVLAHADFNLALQWISRIRPKKAILTHMSHEIDYDVINKELKQYIEANKITTEIMVGYDNYSISI